MKKFTKTRKNSGIMQVVYILFCLYTATKAQMTIDYDAVEDARREESCCQRNRNTPQESTTCLQRADIEGLIKGLINSSLQPILSLLQQLNSTINLQGQENQALEAFDFNATFTTLGASGRLGPTQLGNYYKGQDHDGMVTVDNGTQIFTVPKTGKYIIRVAGGVGGCDNYSGSGCYPGYGAYMQGTFALKQGVKLKILVGQRAPNNFIIAGTGGGGGSFVTLTDNTPLIIAGGGGGTNFDNARHQECDGTTARNGTSGYSNDDTWPGGKDDNGGGGGGGGGLLTDGRSSQNFACSYGTGGEGGKAFVNGGVGGRALFNNVVGGFGGGGGGCGWGAGGGGGGGYSGGTSEDNAGFSCGGGGGSYNDGEDQDNRGGFNNGDGYVMMTYE